MSQPTEYRIEHVRDLLAVPEDKLDACLADMRDWVTRARWHTALIYDLVRAVGEELIEHPCAGFVWIDDGKPGCSGARIEIIRAETGEEVGK